MTEPLTKHVSPADLQALKATLEARRAALDSQRNAHLSGQSRAEHARELLLQDADDAAQHEADRELDLAMTDRDVQELAAVDAALRRVAQGSYGRCADCAAAIPLARLKLAPQTLYCVACATQHERE